MPEEKKKDSFTFSDKIKNSKPAAFKSFANRISSKIGSDGKPRKTLFERTKRDAPFFIAALVALLLLPFLYKYSGQVNEEPMVTPGSEESIFDPERYGFDTATGDPEGQIAQLAGRDPLSLIKGLNSEEEEPSGDYPMQDFDDRSGLGDDASYSDNVTEEHNTNIYKQNAAPATRAAFRRAATKINPLASAGLTSRGGGKLGVGMWGGSLKSAAQKVSAEGPRNSPKPVSLQPLQAAGKPSRSYFGQGAAAEARRSRDAMSKANAMQALMDAQMKPVEPGKIGGLTGGSFAPGGGNGDLKRSFAFNGKEPWWWDMMKKRSQMEWEAKFNRRWDWIKWKDKLFQNILGGVLNCLITGTDDGGMGKLFGAAAGAGGVDKCAGLTKSQWEEIHPGVEFSKDMCRHTFGYKVNKDTQDPWQSGNANEITMGPIAQRLDCLSNGLFGSFLTKLRDKWFGKNKGTFAEVSDCSTFAQTGVYNANFSSTKGGWTVLHYVVGIPTASLTKYYQSTPDMQKKMLVVGYIGSGPEFNSNITAVSERKNFVPMFIESVAIKNKKVDSKKSPTASTQGYKYNGYFGTDKKTRKGGFSATSYEDALAKCNQLKFPLRKDCKDQINQQATDVDKVKKMVALTDGGALPTYNELMDVLREGGAIRDVVSIGEKENLSLSTKGAKEGKDWVTGARCPYPLVRVSCEYLATASQKGQEANGYPFAHLTFANGMTGAETYNAMKNRFLLAYTVQGVDNSQPKAITTPTDSAKGQWFYIPHMNVKPFLGSWSKEMTEAGFVTNNLGTERTDLPGKGNDYQIVATSQEIQKLRANNNRIVITWKVFQCPSIMTDGSSINKGGCNQGTINIVKDKQVVGSEGQSFPGKPVSEATCVYYDGSQQIGFPVNVEEEPEPAPEPAPAPAPEPGKTVLQLANTMNGTKGIADRFNTERTGLLQMPSLNVYGKTGQMPYVNALATSNCTAVGNTRKSGQGAAKMFNQGEVKAYIDSVLSATNGSEAFTKANTTIEHSGVVSVPQLVDAMTIAYARDPNAQVPVNAVCALGKTIAFNSYDPQMMRERAVWRNTFGAFVAYTGPNSSYYPSRLTLDSRGSTIVDRRFLGCGSASGDDKKTYNALASVRPYHYGRYNWNEKAIGDQAQNRYAGQTGRDSYLNELTKGGWAKNGFDANTYPLRSLAKAVGFVQKQSASAQELASVSTNATIDDINRQEYARKYASLFNEADTSCGLTGNMPVAEALEYVGAVCINGKNAKPSNGNNESCSRRFRASSSKGTSGGEVEGETVGYTVE